MDHLIDEIQRLRRELKAARLVIRQVQHIHVGSSWRLPETCELCRLLEAYDDIVREEPAQAS